MSAHALRTAPRFAPRAGLLALVLTLAGLAPPAVAPVSAQYFGKNKVQYREFKWQVLKTDHFEVYFYEGERATAIDAARMAERSYARLSKVLSYEISRPVPLILYASHTDFQQTNVTSELISEGTGGVTEFLKRRVFLPFTGSYAELEHVLTHELVHAFQVDVLFGSGGGVSANPLGGAPPLWFMEGMAEYLSIGRVDEHTDMWLRDGALQGYLTPIGQLALTGDIRVYRYGQSIFAFVGEKFGDEKIGEILKGSARMGTLDGAFKSAIGMSLEELSDAWMEETRKHYLPRIVDYEKASRIGRRLTYHGADLSDLNLVPTVTPDGDQVAFISDRSLHSDIYLADAATGDIKKRLLKGERTGNFESLRFFNTSMAWSPDGKFLVFPAKIGGEDAITILDVAKGKVVRQLRLGLDGIVSPAFSPDGETIVFTGLVGGQSDLFTVKSDGSSITRLTEDRFTDRDPQFSPDGKTIAFTTDRGPRTDFDRLIFENYKIALYDLESRTITPLGNMSQGKNIAPQWAPDGKEILFVSDRTGISNLYSIDLSTMDVYQLTNILTGITGIIPTSSPISLSRDGSRVVFSAFDEAGWDLFSIEDPLSLKGEPMRESSIAEALPPAAVHGPSAAADSTPPGFGVHWAGSGTARIEPATAEPAPPEPEPAAAEAPSREPRVIDLGGLYPEADRPTEEAQIAASGPEFVLPDTSSFKISGYKLRFTQDFLHGGAAFASNVGFAGQTALAFSDILGNHNIMVAANIYGSITDSEILLAYENRSRRTNYGVAAFQYRNDFYVFTPDNTNFESDVHRGVQGFVSYPFSKFKRLELGLEAVAVSSRVYDDFFYTVEAPSTIGQDRLLYLQPSVAMVKDNALYGSTGPIDGTRSRFSYDQAFGDLQFSTSLVDYRRYVNFRHRYALAFRVLGGASDGDDPQLFYVGGAYTFRGADYRVLRGTRMGLVNIEFRYPLIDRLRLGILPLDLRGIRGVVFYDMASAWYGKDFRFFDNRPGGGTRLENVHGAFGWGARINLGYFILRYDFAWRTNLEVNLGWIDFFTLSADF